MYSDLFKAQQQRHEFAILRRIFPDSTADDVTAFPEMGERYSLNPQDRIEVVAVGIIVPRIDREILRHCEVRPNLARDVIS